MSYTKNALLGFSWQTILKFATAGLTLGKIFILARILSPSDFGLFSLITIALGVSEATTETGVNVTIIQSKRSINYFLDTAWVISIIRGLLIGILMLLISLILSRFYEQPILVGLIGLAAFVPVIKGFINPAVVKLQKELRFFEDSVYRFSLVLVESIVVVILAVMFKSVWVLVLSLLASALFDVLITQILFSTKPKFNYIKSRGDIILKNARWLSFSAFFSYLHENLDNLIIGKLAGPFNLGVYHNAYGLTHKATYDFAKSTVHGTFPIFTKLQSHPLRLFKAFITSSWATLLLIGGISLPLLLFPELFVQIILGEEWTSAVPLVRWLVGAGLLQSITALLYNFFIAQKKYLAMNIHLLTSVVLMVVLLILLIQTNGFVGAAQAIFFSRLLSLPVIGFSTVQLLRNHD